MDTLDTSYNAWLALPVPEPGQLSQLRQQLAEAATESSALTLFQSLKTFYESRPIYVPVYILNLWPRLHSIIQYCRTWATANSTLIELVQSNGMCQSPASQLLARLSVLSIDTPLPALLHFRTSNLPVLLGNAWLSDDHLNAGVQFINIHPQRSKSVYALDTFWMAHLRRSLERSVNWTLQRPSVTDSLIANHTATELLIPVHQPSHWTLLYVNIPARHYAYADTLNPAIMYAPAEYVYSVNSWLSGILGSSITLVPTVFPFEIGSQSDSHSCGVAVLTNMAHCALKGSFQPWAQPTAKLHRLQWALWLSGTFSFESSPDTSSSDASPPSSPYTNSSFTPLPRA